ncbi:hypothetical protein OEZ85_008678 [Tetradesmus obliquus]|uniref:Uncharacterized protein n=1 Tax=Tetradesmus obliquus TaxID=3088 RepID=A0ABY8TJT3_TETOB|nr:hypothetical protein OEZ85_008678 [Tetradesmus obliquus]
MQGGGTQNGLRGQALEDHVLDRIKHFAVVFAQELVPGITQQQLDLAFSRALYSISAQDTSGHAQLELKFNHNCRFLGCVSQDCMLCKNNPHKTCDGDDNFDEAYADNQVLRARCEAEIFVDLINQVSGEVYSAPGVEVQLSVIDGDAYNSTAPDPLATIMELHTSDEGVPLLQCYGTNRAIHVGTVVVALQNGRAKLPEVFVTDKNDTFHFGDGATTGHFRLLALAMRRDELGNPVPVEGVAPAVSNTFVVKTQRALNDYRKSAYPHYRDELTRLRYIGAITAARLKDARAWLGRDVPLECVDSVQSLKQLLEYVDTNRQVEDKLLALLNMRGRHRHKWDFLRAVLADKVVYDDSAFRVWYAPGSNGCGLLYATKQAQVQNMDKPAGVAQRVTRPDGTAVVQVMMLSDIHQHPQLLEWRRQAEAAWREPSHPGWQVLQEEIDYEANGFGPGAMQQQLDQLQQLRMQSETMQSSAAAAAAAAIMRSQSEAMALRTQSEAMLGSHSAAMALRTHSEQVPNSLHGQQQQQQQAMAMGLARLQAHMQQAQAAAQQQLPQQTNQQQQQQQQQLHDEDELLPPIAEEAAGSVFMMQHHMDAVELALRDALQRGITPQQQQQQQQQQHAAQELMGLSGGAGGAAVGQMVFGGAAASDVDGSVSTEGGKAAGVGKRGRTAGELQAVADPESQGVLFMTASRERHKPVARGAAADTVGEAARPITDFTSLTAEDVERLQGLYNQARGDALAERDNEPAEPLPEDDDVLGGGMNLTSTFSSALKLGETDSLEAALLSKGLHHERSLNHTSDSFKRFMAHLGCDEAGGLATGLSGNALEGMLDGTAAGFNPQDFLAGNSRGRGGAMDAAAAAAIAAIDAEAQQQRGKQLQSSK